MPRAARVVAAGAPRHVTQRGNNRQRTFHFQHDYKVDPTLLAERARQYECRVLGYCLIPNHVHLVVIPDRGDALALALVRAAARGDAARPALGGERFVREISDMAGRDLMPGPRGRPRGDCRSGTPIAGSALAGG